MMSMLVRFEVYEDGGWWCGRGTDESIFTQGRTFDDLCVNIRDEVTRLSGEGSTYYMEYRALCA